MMFEKTKHNWHIGMIVSLVGFKNFKGDRVSPTRENYRGIELRDKNDIVGWLRDYRPSDKGLWLPNPLRKI
jgi:hypothetical protein